MIQIETSLKVKDGLLKDRTTGDYLVLSGYSHQALRYSMSETWLDEDDNLWIRGTAVERELKKERDGE
ncbi:MAG TPA: hypothetical protein VLQ48_02585 [Chloroflexia bacterium]|jgi:hypothetical protein|nr:hypothetical protein [Chloroflexia bacterium]